MIDEITPVSAAVGYAPQRLIVPVTIANGESLSSVANLGRRSLLAIVTPAAWTTASLTFQGSDDGAAFADIYDDGVERAIASAIVVASRWLVMPAPDLWLSIPFLKLRSGSAASPVNQAALRTIKLVAG